MCNGLKNYRKRRIMKRILLALLFFTLSSVSLVYSLEISTYEFSFEIKSPQNVKEKVSISFRDANVSRLVFKFSNEIRDITVYENGELVSYTFEKIGDEYELKIPVINNSGKIDITATADDMVYYGKNEFMLAINLFIPENIFANVSVFLPEGYVIAKKGYFPENGVLNTDGKRISISWINLNGEVNVVVNFEPSYNRNSDYTIFILIILPWVIVMLVYYYKIKSFENLLRGFDEVEQSIIRYLSKKKVCYQRDVVSDLSLNKVKVSRTIKKLESKGMVRKEKIGRKTKIYWMKSFK